MLCEEIQAVLEKVQSESKERETTDESILELLKEMV